jgi:hypothetical protein
VIRNDQDTTNGGNDIILLGKGNDIALGGGGDDQIDGQSGDDIVFGDYGEISLSPNGAINMRATQPGFGGDDIILLGEGNDIALGGGGDDRIDGQSGDDIVFGDFADISLSPDGTINMQSTQPGFGGDDNILLGEGNDIALGGGGNDQIDGQSGDDIIFGDFADITVSPNGRVNMQSTQRGIGGDDVLKGGGGNDILVGGAGSDLFYGSLDEDILVGNYARIEKAADFKVTLLVADAGSGDIVSSAQRGLYRPNPLARTPQDSSSLFSADEDRGADTAFRSDIALRMTPLLNSGEISRLSDSELQEYLRSLPLLQADNPAGYEVTPLFHSSGSGGSPPAPPGDEDEPEQEAPEQVSPETGGAPVTESAITNSDALTDGSELLQDTLVAPVAGALLAARASRRQGWNLGVCGPAQARIQGDLSKLRKLQAEQQFKVWRKH